MTPQSPELRRSGNSPTVRDAPLPHVPPPQGVEPEAAERLGPVPEANRPGHHPSREQDKPDTERVADALGTRQKDDAMRTVLRTAGYGVGFAAGAVARTVERMAEGGWQLARRVLGRR